MKFDTPSPQPDVDKDGKLDRVYTAFFQNLRDGIVSRSQAGTTAQRPISKLEVGTTYFDSTLGKPVWIKSLGPTVWVDATGTPV